MFEKIFDLKGNKMQKKSIDYRKESHDEYKERAVQPNGARYEKCGENVWRLKEATSEDSAVIMCAGDLMCEPAMSEAVYFEDDGSYNFKSCFKYIRPVLAESDFAIANLETMVTKLAPYTRETHRMNHHTGVRYHCNAPVSYLDACRYAGFDGFVMANNHNADCNYDGLVDTLNNIDGKNFARTGLFKDEEDPRTLIVEINGIRVGVLSYTEHINRNLDQELFTEKGQAICFNKYAPEKVKTDIAAIKAQNIDFLICYIHFLGKDYSHTVLDRQKTLAQALADAGADCVMGSHMHALQTCDMIQAKDGRMVPVAYSLGNFITSDNTSFITKTGIIYKLTLQKKDGKVELAETAYIPYKVFENLQRSAPIVFPAQSRWRKYTTSPALDQALKDIADVIGTSVKLDDGPKKTEQTKKVYKDKVLFYVDDLCRKNVSKELIIRSNAEPDFQYKGIRLGDEHYTSLRFAIETEPGCAAVISPVTGNPDYKPTEWEKNHYADLAMQKGAKVLITDKQIKDYPCIIVDDVFQTMCTALSKMRALYSPKAIAVTGSIGKTTVTSMLNAVVSKKFNTLCNVGNGNTIRYTGIMLQRMTSAHTMYIQEAMEGPPYGYASRLSKMIQPQAAIITFVGTSHMEHFKTQERVCESCFGIEDGLPEDGLLILNGDDPFQVKTTPKRTAVYYAIDNPNADYRAVNIRIGGDHLLFDVHHHGVVTPVKMYCFGRHNVLDALAAFAAAKWAGMSDQEIAAGLESFRTTGIRQNMVSVGDQRIFLDCYNSSVEAVKSSMDSIDLMKQSDPGMKVIAVLGDILECGDSAREYHRKVGKIAHESLIDGAVFYGKDMKAAMEYMEEVGTNKSVFWTDNFDELVSHLKEISAGDTLLTFKSSRGMELERAVDKAFGSWYHEQMERDDSHAKAGNSDGFKYTEYSDHITITGRDRGDKELVIPADIKGKKVTGIEKSAFTVNGTIASIQFPETLENIRYCSFYKNNKLESVHIPGSVRILDKSAFSTCENLKEVTIEYGCIEMGYRAFGNCKNLTRIVIPSSVKKIGGEAFLNCSKLTIYGEKGSYAEQYAKKSGIRFAANSTQ